MIDHNFLQEPVLKRYQIEQIAEFLKKEGLL